VTRPWNAWPLAAQVGAAALAAMSVLAVLPSLLNAVTGADPSGPTGSSYATAPEGAAAYAALLARQGFDVSRSSDRAPHTPAATGATLIALGVPLTRADLDGARTVLARGGRVVLGGEQGEDALRALTGRAFRWTSDGVSAARISSRSGDFAGVEQVVGAGVGSWTGGAERRILGSAGTTTALAVPVGPGVVFALADLSPLTNAHLARGHNAAFGVGLVGPQPRAVVFAEHGHGYGARSGLDAVPGRWKTWAIYAAIATAVLLWSRGKRFGPPDPEPWLGAPRRVEHVHAVAAVLARTGDRDGAVTRLRAQIRGRARRRLRAEDVSPGSLRAAGLEACARESELGRVSTDEDVLTVGRALNEMEHARW